MDKEEIVRKQIVKLLHREIKSRYEIDHLESIPEIVEQNLLSGIGYDEILKFENMFLSVVYPEIEERHNRDKSFESLIKMMKNPRALASIIPSIPMIMIKYSTRFPSALRVGLNSVIAFNLSMRLENSMVENILKISNERNIEIDESFEINFEDYKRAYVTVPFNEAKKMIGLSMSIIKAGSRQGMMNTAWCILDEVQCSLASKDNSRCECGMNPQHKDDIAAIAYGKDVLEIINSTFSDFTRDEIDRIIEISRISETDYMEKMYGKK
ncbi:MAG TPA: hypothetical protein PLN69_07695 [bacterium]|nr:hypothetical protein [bacterium]